MVNRISRARARAKEVGGVEGQCDSGFARRDLQGAPYYSQLPFADLSVSQAVQALVNPGDPVIIEKPVYAYATTYHVLGLES